jgi:hypothetical protein
MHGEATPIDMAANFPGSEMVKEMRQAQKK